jgi:hypothetical protein
MSINSNGLINTLITGIAPGSDTEWVSRAHTLGEQIIQLYFDGHNRVRSNTHDNHLDSEHDVLLANLYIDRAMKHHNYHFSEGSQFHKLLKAFYFIIKEADSLYIIGSFAEQTDFHYGSRLNIAGKSSWYAEMFVDKWLELYKEYPIYKNIPLYFFDQKKNKWFSLKRDLTFYSIYFDEIPKPTGKYAAVGTRSLNNDGLFAIRSL